MSQDLEVVGKATFQTKSRNSEGAVLVIHLHVRAIIARFRNTPWDAAQFPIGDLSPDHGVIGLVKQRVFITGHHQQWRCSPGLSTRR